MASSSSLLDWRLSRPVDRRQRIPGPSAGWVCVRPLALVLCLGVVPVAALLGQARGRLDLAAHTIDLPGVPAGVVPADLDGDGLGDLAIVLAFTEMDQLGIEEEVDVDGVEGVVEMLTIVPALVDRRELHLLRGLPEGGFQIAARPLELDKSVLSVGPGPEGIAVIALTDDGVSRLVIEKRPEGADDGPQGDLWSALLEPLLEFAPAMRGSQTMLPDLRLVQDFDGDGVLDLFVPGTEEAALWSGADLALWLRTRDAAAGAELATETPVEPPSPIRLSLPEPDSGALVRDIPLPAVEDTNGDGRPDIVLRSGGWSSLRVLLNRGDWNWSEPVEPLAEHELPFDASAAGDGASERAIVHFGDLDGDGRAEWVSEANLADQDAGMRKSMREAKQPPMVRRVFETGEGLSPADQPLTRFESTGYAAQGESDDELRIPGGFRDVDGDGRSDLITVTLEFSMLQAVRILATRSISIGLDFHIYCQQPNGEFRSVSGLDLSGKFRLRLTDLRVGQLSQFSGDFDGDGRADFVQLGRGKTVSIHRGRDGCSYPTAPDLTIKLKRAPQNLGLVRIADFDGDGLSDLLVMQPGKAKDRGASVPVRLELYTSRGRS